VTILERFVRLCLATLCLAALVTVDVLGVHLSAVETGLLGGVGAFALPPMRRDEALTTAERVVRLLISAGAIAALVILAIANVRITPVVSGLLGGVAAFALPPVRRKEINDHGQHAPGKKDG
jgi:hypothetical protein